MKVTSTIMDYWAFKFTVILQNFVPSIDEDILPKPPKNEILPHIGSVHNLATL